MSSMRLGGKAVPTASEGYTEDHKFRARLADRYEIMVLAVHNAPRGLRCLCVTCRQTARRS